jgi:hypothetical protein
VPDNVLVCVNGCVSLTIAVCVLSQLCNAWGETAQLATSREAFDSVVIGRTRNLFLTRKAFLRLADGNELDDEVSTYACVCTVGVSHVSCHVTSRRLSTLW